MLPASLDTSRWADFANAKENLEGRRSRERVPLTNSQNTSISRRTTPSVAEGVPAQPAARANMSMEPSVECGDSVASSSVNSSMLGLSVINSTVETAPAVRPSMEYGGASISGGREDNHTQGCERSDASASFDSRGIPSDVEKGRAHCHADCDPAIPADVLVELPSEVSSPRGSVDESKAYNEEVFMSQTPEDNLTSERLAESCDNAVLDGKGQLRTAIARLAAHFGKPDFPRGPANLEGWGINETLRLRGGAGAAADANSSNSSSGGGGWGANAPGGGAGGGNPPPAWNQPPPAGNTGGQPPAGAGGQWGSQANAPKPMQANGANPNGGAGGAGGPNPAGGANAQPSDSQSQKRELEKIREALFATDGWGGNHVNQDSDWSVPPSPPRSPGADNSSWRPGHSSNGTEIWETNLRNGGVPAVRPPDMSSSKPSWSRHGSSNEFGGQWDPEDDSTEVNSSSWNNPQSSNQWGSGGGGGGGGGGMGGGASGAPMWAGAKDKSGIDWSNPGATATAGGPGGSWGGPAQNRWGSGPGGKPMGPGGPGMPAGPPWGSKPAWGDDNQPGGKGGDDGTSMWSDQNAMRKNDRNLGRGMPGGPAMRMPPNMRPPGQRGWDDGGADQGGAGGWGMPPSSPPNVNAPGGWGQKPKSGMGWGDSGDMMDPSGGWKGGWTNSGQYPENWASNWSDSQRRTFPMKQAQPKMMGKDMWGKPSYGMYKDETGMGMGRNMDDMSDMGGYGGHRDPMSSGNDPSGMGGVGMGMPGSGPSGWPHGPGGSGRMDDPHSAGGFGGAPGGGADPYGTGAFGNPMMHGGAGMNRGPSSGFPGQMQQNMQPFMQQQQQQQVRGGGGVRPAGAPNSQQLHVLVNQIHMAVQAGHLNPQILNQKLSSQTLFLLNELLGRIKILQGLQQEHQEAVQQSMSRGGAPNPNILQFSVKITQTKQQIQNLQNQINAQQGLFAKNQTPGAPGGGPGLMMGPSGSFQKFPGVGGMGGPSGGGSGPDGGFGSMNSLMGSMNLGPSGGPAGGDLSGGGMGGMGVGMGAGGMPGVMDHGGGGMPPANSRFFNNWGLGATTGMLGAPSDGTWATPGSTKVDGGGWPDSGSSSSSAPSSQQQQGSSQASASSQPTTSASSASGAGGAANYSMPDVPEFEPGKPWKGNQMMKNIEDDPTATPGSVKKSPFSVAGIKDTDLSMKATTATSSSSDTSTTNTTKSGAAGGGATTNGANWNYQSNRTWLVLNNLSPSMDSSTLKTLCMQHGPLNAFNLIPHQGMALVRYSTYEEAAKAQISLHNCVLGSTSVRAEFVSDAEVQAFLGGAQGGGGGGGYSQQQQQPQTSWSNATTSQASTMSKGHEGGWAQPGLATWSTAGGNPSSLWDAGDQSHSYLPENLI